MQLVVLMFVAGVAVALSVVALCLLAQGIVLSVVLAPEDKDVGALVESVAFVSYSSVLAFAQFVAAADVANLAAARASSLASPQLA